MAPDGRPAASVTPPSMETTVASDETTVDEAIEAIGTGRWQRPTLLAAGLTWSGDAMELGVLAYVLPVLKREWAIAEATADALASVLFLGMLLGSLGWGIFTDLYGRRRGWLVTTLLTCTAGLASALVPEGAVAGFIAARTCVGVGLAGTNLGFALSAELLPRRGRGTLLMLFELFFVGGSVLLVLLAWLLLGRGAGSWRWVLALSTAPLVAAAALAPWVLESPRWLVGRGHATLAADALRRGARLNRRPPPLSAGARLAAASHAAAAASSSSPRHHQGTSGARRRAMERAMRGLADVFHPSFRLASASLCLAYFLNTFVRRRALVTHRLGEVDQGRRAPFFRQVYFGLIMLTPRLLAAAALPVDAGAGEFASSLLATLSELPGLAAATWGVSRFGASAGTFAEQIGMAH